MILFESGFQVQRSCTLAPSYRRNYLSDQLREKPFVFSPFVVRLKIIPFFFGRRRVDLNVRHSGHSRLAKLLHSAMVTIVYLCNKNVFCLFIK